MTRRVSRTLGMMGLTLTGALVLSACSNGDNTAEVTEQSAAGAAAFAETYYEEVIASSDESMEAAEQFESTMSEIMTDEQYVSTPENLEDPLSVVRALKPEAQRELADAMQELNPVSESISFNALDDAGRFMVNLMVISGSTVLPGSEDVKIDPESVSVEEENHATIPFEKIMMVDANGNEVPSEILSVVGNDNAEFIYANGEWKFDPTGLYDTLETLSSGEEEPEESPDPSENPAKEETVLPEDGDVTMAP